MHVSDKCNTRFLADYNIAICFICEPPSFCVDIVNTSQLTFSLSLLGFISLLLLLASDAADANNLEWDHQMDTGSPLLVRCSQTWHASQCISVQLSACIVMCSVQLYICMVMCSVQFSA